MTHMYYPFSYIEIEKARLQSLHLVYVNYYYLSPITHLDLVAGIISTSQV